VRNSLPGFVGGQLLSISGFALKFLQVKFADCLIDPFYFAKLQAGATVPTGMWPKQDLGD
jgi:hypothetical protein